MQVVQITWFCPPILIDPEQQNCCFVNPIKVIINRRHEGKIHDSLQPLGIQGLFKYDIINFKNIFTMKAKFELNC